MGRAWWRLPKWQVARLALKIRDPKARADIEDNFRKTVGQALGGAAVLIGAVVAYLQFTQQQQTSHNQLQAAHDLLISNQIAKGFEQLASDKITMRLGGLYALAAVMNTSSDYHQPVLEALCAFVRDNTKITKDKRTIKEPAAEHPATDIQAALTVIGRRTDGPGRVALTSANISGAILMGANLRGALLGGVDLRGAYLIGAILEDADMRYANLNDADLSDADLTSANLTNANLIGAILVFAHLSGALLGGADLHEANLGGANLSAITTGGAVWINATLSDSNLSDANLNDADLSGNNLNGADLSGADLTRANLSKVRNLVQEQLDKACGKPKVLPPGLTLDKPCPPRPVALPLNLRTTP